MEVRLYEKLKSLLICYAINLHADRHRIASKRSPRLQFDANVTSSDHGAIKMVVIQDDIGDRVPNLDHEASHLATVVAGSDHEGVARISVDFRGSLEHGTEIIGHNEPIVRRAAQINAVELEVGLSAWFTLSRLVLDDEAVLSMSTQRSVVRVSSGWRINVTASSSKAIRWIDDDNLQKNGKKLKK